MTTETYTRTQVTNFFAKLVKETGGPSKFSRKYDISEGYVRNVATGRIAPGPRCTAIMGLEKAEDTWVRK